MPSAVLSVSGTAPNTVVAAGLASERIRVTSLSLTANTNTTLTFSTSTGNTAISGTFTLAAGVPLTWPESQYAHTSGRQAGWLQTNAGDALQVALGVANTSIGGVLNYVLFAE